MTTIELGQRMTRYLTHGDILTLPPSEALLVVDAINTGLGEYVSFLPAIRREERTVQRLAAPLTKAVTLTQDSPAIVFTPAYEQAGQLGRSVLVATDSGRRNRLIATDTLQLAYLGATGATSLTIYSDSVQLAQGIDEVAGKVFISGGGRQNELTFRHREPSWFDSGVTTGLPTEWSIEPLSGMTGLNEPQFLLRVWPLPPIAADLTYMARLFPSALTFGDLRVARQLPVPALEISHLVNLCAPGLFSSPLWRKEITRSTVDAAYSRSVAAMERDSLRKGHSNSNSVRTEKGF